MNRKTSDKRLHLSLTLSIALLYACGSAQALEPFKSDGCSSFPDGTLEDQNLWLSCCTAHDLAYWRGGTYEERLQSDLALRQCVAQTGQEEIALLMLAGVRVGGTPYLPTKFRWAYGWPFLRGYKALTAEENTLIESLLSTQPQEGKSATKK